MAWTVGAMYYRNEVPYIPTPIIAIMPFQMGRLFASRWRSCWTPAEGGG